MASSPRSPQPSSSRRAGRGRIGLALALVLAILIGRGVGWFGRDAAPSGGDGAANVSEAAVPPAPAPSPMPTAPPPATTTPPTTAANAVPTTTPAPSAVPTPRTADAVPDTKPPAAPPTGETKTAAKSTESTSQRRPTMDADRFASLLSLLVANTGDGDLGGALATLHHLRGQSLDEPQAAAVAGAIAPLEAAVGALCAQLVQSLCRGQVLAARADVARLCGDGHAFAAPWLDSAMQAIGRRDGLLRERAAKTPATLPIAKPLARGREVRVLRQGRLLTGIVVESKSDQVTVRLPSPTGLSFPTVAVVATEPVAASRDEAIEMAWAALHAGDVVLARLWFAYASEPGEASLSERGRRLGEALQ
jgi:hypothetical protein